MTEGKYRWRTTLRKKTGLPIPKGEKCSHHSPLFFTLIFVAFGLWITGELYVAEQSPGGGAKVWHCYHCDYELTPPRSTRNGHATTKRFVITYKA